MITTLPDFNINLDNLNPQLAHQAGDYGYWVTTLGTLLSKEVVKQREVEKKSDDVYLKFKNQFDESGQKVTESYISVLVRSDPEVKVLLDSLAEIQQELKTTKSVVNALERKQELLVAIASNKRKEIDSNIEI